MNAVNAAQWGERLAAAHRAGALLPRVTPAEPELDLDAAYAIQRAFVACLSAEQPIVGFKGALTAPPAQRAMRMDAPVTGVLLRHRTHEGGSRVARADFQNLVLETELSFRVGRAVTTPLADAAAARAIIGGVAPAVELANLAFADGPPTGLDLVAGNSAFGSFIRGAEVAVDDLDHLPVNLARAGETLHAGSSGDVLGGQLEAVRWLINSVLARGYALQGGEILLTGSIGGLQPGTPGDYVANYGQAGVVAFSVT